jgi:hypothetical protein
MKVFVIGGAVSRPKDAQSRSQGTILRKSMQEVGRSLIRSGHDLLICSPHRGSADIEAFRVGVKALATTQRSCIEFHTPDLEDTQRELQLLVRSLPHHRIKRFVHPVSADDHGKPNLTYSWLLSQLSALARCQLVLALAGRTDGSASLLLPIAEAQQKPILPLTFLGGAATQSFERQRNVLETRLADKIVFLHDKNRVAEAVKLINILPNLQAPTSSRQTPIRVFLSYPNTRKNDADSVESILLSYGCEVFRDKATFGAGRSIVGEIREYIHAANVFVAIWCQEYACSPWCFDEIEMALARHGDGRMTLWILCFDNTPIIPPAARPLAYYQIPGRRELETIVRNLLGQLEANSTVPSRQMTTIVRKDA